MGNDQSISTANEKAHQRKDTLLGALLVFISAVSWGVSGTIVQYLTQSCGVTVEWLNAARMAGTAVILLPVALAVPTTRREVRGMLSDRTDLRRIIVYAIFGAFACQVGYLFAISYTNSGTATMMEQFGLVLVMLFTCISMRRLPTRRELVALILAIVGVYCICTKGDLGNLAISGPGLAWGVVAAISMASYILLPVKLLEKYRSLTVTSLAMTIGGIFVCLLFRPWDCMPQLTFPVVLGTFGTIMLGTVIAYVCFLEGVRRVGAVVGGLLDAVEPVTAIVVSAVWLGTVVTPFDALGCTLIVIMMILITLPERAQDGS